MTIRMGAGAGPVAGGRRRRTIGATASRVLLFAVLWVVLTGRPAESWPYGAVAVGLAVPLSLALLPARPYRLALVPLVLLLPLLAWTSILGGIDVARRAFAPRLPIAPGVIEYRLRHRRAGLAVALGYAATVVPGTLVLDIRGDRLLVHVIDRAQPNEAALARIERWLARAIPEEG